MKIQSILKSKFYRTLKLWSWIYTGSIILTTRSDLRLMMSEFTYYKKLTLFGSRQEWCFQFAFKLEITTSLFKQTESVKCFSFNAGNKASQLISYNHFSWCLYFPLQDNIYRAGHSPIQKITNQWRSKLQRLQKSFLHRFH